MIISDLVLVSECSFGKEHVDDRWIEREIDFVFSRTINGRISTSINTANDRYLWLMNVLPIGESICSFLSFNDFSITFSSNNPEWIFHYLLLYSLGVASVINHTSELFAYFFLHELIHRFGHIKILYLGLLGNFVRFVYISIITNPWWVLPFEFIQGRRRSSIHRWFSFV